MSVANCIDAAAFEGAISRKTADEAKKKYKDYADSFSAEGKLSRHEFELRAAQRLEADLVRDRFRRKRMRTIQATKQAEITQRIVAAPAGQENRAALAVLEFDPRMEFLGDNVVARHAALRGRAWALASDFIYQFRSKMAGLKRDTTELGDVVKALFGEGVENQNAKALAQGVQEARSYLLKRHNAAGGDIRLRKEWGWVQRHDADKMTRNSPVGSPDRVKAQREWMEYIFPRLDPAKMFDVAGQPMTERQVWEMLGGVWNDLTQGRFAADEVGEFTSPVNRRIQHRELAFRDSTAWLEYQQTYGSGDMLSAIIGELDNLARDTALMEILGPYPNATIQAMKDSVPDIAKHAFIDSVFAHVSGALNVALSKSMAKWGQNYRNIATASKLGSAIFMTASDFWTARTTALYNGLPQTKLFGNYLSMLSPTNPSHRKMAARLGYVTETWIGDMVAAQRMVGEVSSALTTARVADTVLRASGLSAHTEALRNAFRLTFVSHLSDQAGKVWNALPDDLRASLQRHGISESDWELYRSTPFWTDPETGADFIRPEDVYLQFQETRLTQPLSIEERQGRFKAAQKFADMIDTEAKYAVIMPTNRAKAGITAKLQPGTVWGEVARTVALFRSWTAAFFYLHGSRAYTLPGGGMNKVRYAADMAVALTLAGAFATQASSLARGRDPLDMTTADFWGQAVLRGGALGPFGDLISSGQTRWGGGWVEAIVGPAASEIANLSRVVGSGVSGDLGQLGSDSRRLLEGLMPGNTLWYTRLAFERMVKDQAEMLANPDVTSQWRKAETKAKKELNQQFWWRRGRVTPERAPKLGMAVGE